MAQKPPKKPKVKKVPKKAPRKTAAEKLKEFLKRSAAAKLGRIRKEKRILAEERSAREYPNQTVSDKKWLADYIKEQNRWLKQLQKEMEAGEGFVREEVLAMKRRDGTMAKQSSRLRPRDEGNGLYERLDKAYQGGDASFDAEARRIAKEQNVLLKEVYTLFISP